MEKKLQNFKDSITLVQQQLVALIEAPLTTIRTKEKAVYVLATIHSEDVLEYLFKNEKNLRFGSDGYMETGDYNEESTRTAMIGIFKEYLSNPEINWMVFPFVLKYVKTVGGSEIGLIRWIARTY